MHAGGAERNKTTELYRPVPTRNLLQNLLLQSCPTSPAVQASSFLSSSCSQHLLPAPTNFPPKWRLRSCKRQTRDSSREPPHPPPPAAQSGSSPSGGAGGAGGKVWDSRKRQGGKQEFIQREIRKRR